MSVKAIEASLEICYKSDWSISNLKLQKILYIIHKVFLGRNEGEPLIENEFYAWDYGPVIPLLYREFKKYASDPIERGLWTRNINHLEENTKEYKIIEEGTLILKNHTGSELISITHKTGGAWDRCYEPKVNNIIPNETIYEEYTNDQQQKLQL